MSTNGDPAARTRTGVNGFGRMGRIALRAGWQRDDNEWGYANRRVELAARVGATLPARAER